MTTPPTRARSITLISLLAASLSACGSGSGGVSVNTWGEEYIEEEIPTEEFADGWRVRFTSFVIPIGPIVIADREGVEGARDDMQRAFDLVQPGPHPVVEFAELEAKRWEDVRVTHPVAMNAIAGHAGLDATVLGRLNSDGLSLLVSGTAETGTISKSFEWAFTEATDFHSCQLDGDGLGAVVPSGEVVELQFTVHGDHLFYDSFESDAVLRFDAMAAADADGDGRVSLEELEAVDLTTLPADQYSTGGVGTVTNLRQFVTAQTRTLMHFQGEGHCEALRP